MLRARIIQEMDRSTLTKAYVSLRQEHNDLRVVGGTDVDPSGFTLLAILRNEMYFLPAFLAHYRGLGVERFVFLDDRSDDGSFEYLVQQPDTVVVHSDFNFGHKVKLPPTISGPVKDSRIEFLWRSILHGSFAPDRWALQLDLDEFIHLPQGMTFPDLAAQLDEEGTRALWAVMLDVYPKDIATFTENERSSRLDISASWYFDGERHLRLRQGRPPKLVYPGARARLYQEYGVDRLYSILGIKKRSVVEQLSRNLGLGRRLLRYNVISKPALLKWRDDSYFITPHNTNLPASTRYLLPIQHFRFSGSLGQKVRMALQDNSHFLDSSDYRLLMELLCTMMETDGSFLYRKSRPIESFDDFSQTRNAVGF